MPLYNTSAMQNATTIGEIFVLANTATTGLFFGLSTVALFFIILFYGLVRNEFDNVLMIDSFICFVISAFLAYGGFISIIFPLAYLIMLAFSALLVWMLKPDQ